MKKLSVRELFQLAKGKEVKCCNASKQDESIKSAMKETDDKTGKDNKNNCCG